MNQAFLIALQFLTAIPVRLSSMPEPRQLGQSMLYYPLVGAVLGGALLLLAWLLQGAEPVLQAIVLLLVWVALSGALHLDGLADAADAWMGGLGNRERTLAIMKDPRCGPVAVVTLVLLLLLKLCALWVLLRAGQYWALLLAPVLGRSALLGLFAGTRYVRQDGLGSLLSEHLPRPSARRVLLGVLLLVALLPSGWLALLAALLVFAWGRRTMIRRLQGTTGDTAGALLELVEAGVLLALALAC